MSTCISREGEYSEHEQGTHCPRCGAFNEEAIIAERDALRAHSAAQSRSRLLTDGILVIPDSIADNFDLTRTLAAAPEKSVGETDG